jgi:hypothetical protein
MNELDYYELKLKNEGFEVSDEDKEEFRYFQRYQWKPTKAYRRMLQDGAFFKNTKSTKALRNDLLDSSILYETKPKVSSNSENYESCRETGAYDDVKVRIGKEYQASISEFTN